MGLEETETMFETHRNTLPAEGDVEARCRLAQQRGGEAAELSPTPTSYGLFSSDDTPLPMANIGFFMWFEGEAAMLHFVRDHLPYINGDQDPSKILRVIDDLDRIITCYQAAEINREAARASLNKVLRGYTDIEWWGNLQDLATGDSSFVRKLRSEFWMEELETDEVPASDELEAPVGENRLQDFVESIREYGF
jgi:hypothetical protein